jgi:membrane protein involved in colicin uptake
MKPPKFGPRYGFKKFAEGGPPKAKTPANPSANEDIKPPNTPERRKFLAESAAQRRQEAAAAAQRAAEVEARSKAKAAQRSKDAATMKTQAEMDRKMQEAYQRFQNSSENDSPGYKRGGKVKKYSGGGSASKRADGCAVKGKTRGKFV